MASTGFIGKILMLCMLTVLARRRVNDVVSYLASLPGHVSDRHVNLISLIVDTSFDLPVDHFTIVHDSHNHSFITRLCMTLQYFGVKTSLYQLEWSNEPLSYLEKFMKDVKDRSSAYLDANYLFFTSVETSEDVASTIHMEKLGRRNIIYLFLWPGDEISQLFLSNLDEVARICVITNPRRNTYHVHYNQAEPDGSSKLTMINWWTWPKGFFQSPLLPPSSRVFKNLKGRVLIIPVLHKPPWHFVVFNNNSLHVDGGRDDKLLSILSEHLNFRYEYFDPPDRSEGSAMVNGTMQGVLGLIWQGEVEVFIGDLTITFERSLVVEFSFFTLSDSEVFLTHAPGKLNEALALVRPFQWEVWPAIILTVGLSGPLLYFFKQAKSEWKSTNIRDLCDCVWISTTIFLRQSLVAKIQGDPARLAVILLYLIATYVIGDMYSANLTSLLTRPAREKPISTLEQLNYAMENRNFKLLVERHSASHGVFEGFDIAGPCSLHLLEMYTIVPQNMLDPSVFQGFCKSLGVHHKLTAPYHPSTNGLVERGVETFKNSLRSAMLERQSTEENGSGLYESIWNKMKSQKRYLLDSTEEGIELVKDHKNIALIGGRETFFYNAKRFGVPPVPMVPLKSVLSNRFPITFQFRLSSFLLHDPPQWDRNLNQKDDFETLPL